MMLIGLTGPAGCGKDTAGEILRNNHRFITTSLAYPIKAMICTMLGVTIDHWEDREWKERPSQMLNGKSPRFAAQTLGTEWGRAILGQDIWINNVFERIDREGLVRVGITDVRFDNEAIRIREAGGYIIKIMREANQHGISSSHSSEAGVQRGLVDVLIQNNGTIQDLADKLDSAVGAMYA